MKTFMAALSILLIVAGCRKDEESRSSHTESQGYIPPTVTLNGHVAGTVTDENGSPMEGISVSTGSATTETDANGFYLFTNIPLDAAGAAITVNDPGFWHASKHVVPRLNAMHHAHLALIPKEVQGQFKGDEDGTVVLSEGVELSFSAQSLHSEDGSVHLEDVLFTGRSIRTDGHENGRLMPGGLRGIDKNEKTRALLSHGMFAGIVHGPGGNILQPNENTPAELVFSADAAAPPTLGVWYLDEAAGYWRKSGEAQKDGEVYRAEIPHFSFWGLFEDYDPAAVSGTILSESGNEVANAQISFWSDESFITSVFTDTEGFFQANLPAGIDLSVFITDGCNTTVFTQNIGTLSGDTELGDISVPAEDFNTASVSGSAVNCDGEGISSDYAVVCTGSGCAQLFLDADGNFDQTIGLCGSTDLTFIFFDQATGQSASVTENSADSLNIGTVELCDSPAEEFISFTVNGETRFYPNPFSVATLAEQMVRATDSPYDISIAWQANIFVTGTFSDEQVEFKYLEYVPSGLGPMELRQASCDFGTCENIAVTIDTYSLEEGVIEGSFTGTVNYSTSVDGEQPNTPIEGEFRVGF